MISDSHISACRFVEQLCVMPYGFRRRIIQRHPSLKDRNIRIDLNLQPKNHVADTNLEVFEIYFIAYEGGKSCR